MDTLLTQPGTSAGLIGRFSKRGTQPQIGHFDGYVFDVGASGAWRLTKNDASAGGIAALASGSLAQPIGTGTWHRLSLAMSGRAITASVDGQQVASVSDSSWTSGLAGIEAGAFTGSWPQAQYSGLSITS